MFAYVSACCKQPKPTCDGQEGPRETTEPESKVSAFVSICGILSVSALDVYLFVAGETVDEFEWRQRLRSVN